MSACPKCGAPHPALHPAAPAKVCPDRWHGASEGERRQRAYAMALLLGFLIMLPRGIVEVMGMLGL